MENPLSKLSLDYWYQVLMVVCALVFLLAGAGLLPAYPVRPTAPMSAGGSFIGLGEWINHPLQVRLMHQTVLFPAGVVKGHPRSNNALGVLFVLGGVVLVGFGAYWAFR